MTEGAHVVRFGAVYVDFVFSNIDTLGELFYQLPHSGISGAKPTRDVYARA